jgi:type III pantothenate kinase
MKKMRLAIDVGNSNIKIGLWDGEKWIKQWRRETYPVQLEETYRTIFKQLLGKTTADSSEIDDVALASVAPNVSEPIINSLNGLLGIKPLLINAEMETGIEVKTSHPEQVGADLIAGAVGAYHLINDTCIIVDCGTATTVMVVEKPARLLGGAICNGLKTSVESLIDRTAQLQGIPFEIPASPIGKDTIHAMQSGLINGHLKMIEGLIDQMTDEIGPAKVVATGGLISVLADHTDYFDFVEPTLVLDGVRLIAERNENAGEA